MPFAPCESDYGLRIVLNSESSQPSGLIQCKDNKYLGDFQINEGKEIQFHTFSCNNGSSSIEVFNITPTVDEVKTCKNL